MDEYIKRASIDFPFLNSGRIIDGKLYVCLDEIYAEVKQLPAADVAPVVHGDWWGVGNMVMCTVCEKETYCTSKYCPNCGAKMDGDSE